MSEALRLSQGGEYFAASRTSVIRVAKRESGGQHPAELPQNANRFWGKSTAAQAPLIPNPLDRFLGVIASEAKQSMAKSPMLPMDRHGGFAASR
jgi:hypothetical protein